ncbi:MAG: chemotaxis protein CheW [Syntrophobacterales bacterium]|jgi:purine-binding chemotaxis protein CheW|nr:chemotaxis protein CheW [Syntrophobacterales bacterium]
MKAGPAMSKVTDWDLIRSRLAALQVAIDRGGIPEPEEQQRILLARAQALAQDREPEREAGEYLEVLEFVLASESYALEISEIREVYPLKELTPLPCTPPFVLGIINVRGEILSVLDLKQFFDLPNKGLSDLNKVIILRRGDLEVGLLADVITGVRSLAVSELQASLPTLAGSSADYLKGVTKEALIVLDAAKILRDERIILHQEVEI